MKAWFLTLFTFLAFNCSADCMNQLNDLHNFREYLARKINLGFGVYEDQIQLQLVQQNIQTIRGSLYKNCSLESLFGSRLLSVSTARKSYEKNKGMPAEKMSTVHEKTYGLAFASEKELISLSSQYGADTDTLMGLLGKAPELWNELLICNGSNFEKAREAYRRKRNFCPGNKKKGKQLIQKFEIYHQNVLSFLRTTDNLKEVHEAIVNSFVYCEKEESCGLKSKLSQSYFSVRDLFHPLFGQILLGIISDQGSYSQVENSKNRISNNYERVRVLGNVNEIYANFAPNNCYGLALWPGAARPLTYSVADRQLAKLSLIFSDNCGGITGWRHIYNNFSGPVHINITNRRAVRDFVLIPREIFQRYLN